jgi:hypothetical protein
VRGEDVERSEAAAGEAERGCAVLEEERNEGGGREEGSMVECGPAGCMGSADYNEESKYPM